MKGSDLMSGNTSSNCMYKYAMGEVYRALSLNDSLVIIKQYHDSQKDTLAWICPGPKNYFYTQIQTLSLVLNTPFSTEQQLLIQVQV